MRPVSLILAVVFAFAGSAVAGSSESGLPGAGAFAYSGSMVPLAASQNVALAVR